MVNLFIIKDPTHPENVVWWINPDENMTKVLELYRENFATYVDKTIEQNKDEHAKKLFKENIILINIFNKIDSICSNLTTINWWENWIKKIKMLDFSEKYNISLAILTINIRKILFEIVNKRLWKDLEDYTFFIDFLKNIESKWKKIELNDLFDFLTKIEISLLNSIKSQIIWVKYKEWNELKLKNIVNILKKEKHDLFEIFSEKYNLDKKITKEIIQFILMEDNIDAHHYDIDRYLNYIKIYRAKKIKNYS